MKIVFSDEPIPPRMYASKRADKRNAFFEILDAMSQGKCYRFEQGNHYPTISCLDQWLQMYKKLHPGSRMTRRKDGDGVKVWRIK